MNLVEQNAKLRVFMDLPLAEKIILYERQEIGDPRAVIALFQEMINIGLCWSDEMNNHYACHAAMHIRNGTCAESFTVPMPEEARDPHYLFEPMWAGYDVWGRPPTNEDWGRPLRWKEVRKERIRAFKENRAKQKQGEKLVPDDAFGGCCK